MTKKLNENTQKMQSEINSVTEKLTNSEKQWKKESQDYNDRVNELTASNDLLKDQNKQLDAKINGLLETNEELQIKLTESKIHGDTLNSEIKELKEKVASSSATQATRSITKLQNVNDYIEQVLSLSNYAPITILVRMNGRMSLDALAKSVGMDPIVLENQLQPLHKRDLIDIKHDGLVVANIPSSESPEWIKD